MAFPPRTENYRRAHARIALVGDATHELASLYTWLQHDDEFRGQVKSVAAELKPGDMGGVTEMLTVALGNGGAVMALGATLTAWLSTRRTKISIEVTDGASTCRVEIDSANAGAAAHLLREAFQATHKPS